MTSTAPGLDFLVRKDDWHETKFVDEAEPGALAPGRVRFRVDRFAVTANNITYAVAGDMLGYWGVLEWREHTSSMRANQNRDGHAHQHRCAK